MDDIPIRNIAYCVDDYELHVILIFIVSNSDLCCTLILKKHRISIFAVLKQSISCVHVTHHEINISLQTSDYIVNKLKQINSLERRSGNGRSCIVNGREKNIYRSTYSTEELIKTKTENM
ncbi:unnamed protein product [Rotaria magnacalcarata]